jgi:hypothetical protein
LLESCSGTITCAGQPIPARAVPNNSLDRLRYEVKRITGGGVPSATATDPGPLEPTWARPDKIVTVISAVNPINANALVAAFGANLIGPTYIHMIRNACAHKSIFNRRAVAALRGRYVTGVYKDPIDIIWGQDPQTNNALAIDVWMDELESIAMLATA